MIDFDKEQIEELKDLLRRETEHLQILVEGSTHPDDIVDQHRLKVLLDIIQKINGKTYVPR